MMLTLAGIPPINLSALDRQVLYGTFAVVILWGCWVAFKDKPTSFKTYASHGSFGAVVLAFSIISICYGGEQISIIGSIAEDGIIMALIYIFWSVQFLFAAFWMAPRLARFDQCITVGDIITRCYGSSAGVFASVVGVIYGAIAIGLEYLALGQIASAALGISTSEATFILGSLITIYASISGGRSLLLTGIVQFTILIAAVSILINGVIDHGGSVFEILSRVHPEKLQIFNHPYFWQYVVLLLVWEIFPHTVTGVSVAQRLLATRDTQHIKKAMLGIAAFCIGFACILLLLGFAGHVAFPQAPAQEVFYKLVTHHLPYGLRGFVIAGILMLSISGTDFSLHARSVMLVRNIFHTETSKGLSMVYAARLVILIMGLCAIASAMYFTHIIRVFSFMIGVIAPVTSIPFLGALLFKRVGRVSYWGCVVSTTVTFILCRLLISSNMDYVTPLITLAGGILGYLLVHWYTFAVRQDSLRSC